MHDPTSGPRTAFASEGVPSAACFPVFVDTIFGPCRWRHPTRASGLIRPARLTLHDDT
ncbi:uncharacterized protein TRAVEDRAFT_58957 [Trametes versicolor FP-101664 SS1]|uniref:uncharacterized protein n=1 Tax=Trametes versicolor (strain FP-101664) TaxID=717944 RepID=UPI000462300B|nr:uncharacterized protein TRAVEDRAFT_58957 [Trametes versicolor FP-101664 SS1]EIW57136.1 hypothetical protein TRAVEDRAFT_58957 [Trametes versicolor FP-101664 SS1]